MKLTGCKSFRQARRLIMMWRRRDPMLDSALGRRRLRQRFRLDRFALILLWSVAAVLVLAALLVSFVFTGPAYLKLTRIMMWTLFPAAAAVYFGWLGIHLREERGRMRRLRRMLRESAAEFKGGRG